MNTDIVNQLRLRLASSEKQKQLAKVALAKEAEFLQANEELTPLLYPEQNHKAVFTSLITECESPAHLGRTLDLAGRANASQEDREAARMRAKILLRRAHAPYAQAVVALLKGAENETAQALAEIEKDETRLFTKWGCQPTGTYLRAGAMQLVKRLKEAATALSDVNNQPAKLTHWIRYGSGEVNPGTE